eukprot:3885591-Prymnesium_polylepis.1
MGGTQAKQDATEAHISLNNTVRMLPANEPNTHNERIHRARHASCSRSSQRTQVPARRTVLIARRRECNTARQGHDSKA